MGKQRIITKGVRLSLIRPEGVSAWIATREVREGGLSGSSNRPRERGRRREGEKEGCMKRGIKGCMERGIEGCIEKRNKGTCGKGNRRENYVWKRKWE